MELPATEADRSYERNDIEEQKLEPLPKEKTRRAMLFKGISKGEIVTLTIIT